MARFMRVFGFLQKRIPINGNGMISRIAVEMEKSIDHVIDVIITYRPGIVMITRSSAPNTSPFCTGVPFRQS